MTRLGVLAAAALAGLVAAAAGQVRWRRLCAGRRELRATVVGAGESELWLRWTADGGETGSATVEAGSALAAQWRDLLANGPPEELDPDDPNEWDTVRVSCAPRGSPPVMLLQQLEAAKVVPSLLRTIGILTVVFAALAVHPALLVAAVGLASGILAVAFGVAATGILGRSLRQPAPVRWTPVLCKAAAFLVGAAFVAATAFCALVAEFH